jgi:hypothetical protein
LSCCSLLLHLSMTLPKIKYLDKNSWIYDNTMVMEWKLGITSSGLMVQFFITNAKRNALQSIKCRPRILPLGHQQPEFQLKDAHLPSDNMSCCLGREVTDLQYTKTCG